MTYKTIVAAALCVTMSSVATAETSADQSPVRYHSSATALPVISHQAQLTEIAATTNWTPTTFIMTGVATPIEHQAQHIAASVQANWAAETYAADDTTRVILPIQHQAQLIGLMTSYDWEVSTVNLSN